MQDPYLIEANGNVYIYWTRTTTPGFQLGANMSVAYNTTLAQLVAGYEGVYGFPIPGFNFNLNTLASDNFQRADANPIGGNWTQIHSAAGYTTSQIASNLVEPSAAGSWADSYDNAVAFPNDQWSQHNSADQQLFAYWPRCTHEYFRSRHLLPSLLATHWRQLRQHGNAGDYEIHSGQR